MLPLQDLMREAAKLTTEEQDQLVDFLAQLRRRTSHPDPTAGDILLNRMDDFTFDLGAVDEMMTVIGDAHFANVTRLRAEAW